MTAAGHIPGPVRAWLTCLVAVVVLALAAAEPGAAPVPAQDGAGAQRLDLGARLGDVRVEHQGSRTVFVLPQGDTQLRLAPEEFAARLEATQREREAQPWLKALNITSAAGVLWVCLGFAGQALFTLRMVLQWLASERQKRSVIPRAFWWSSLFGGLMLLVYFVWRKDVVGIAGQSVGVFVYARNLVLLYQRDPGREVQLA